MNNKSVVIIGAGPAGASVALFLAKKGIASTIIDKATFPRDKICGDALSGKTVHIMRQYDESFLHTFNELNHIANPSYGIHFFSPNGEKLSVPFGKNSTAMKFPPGYVSKRIDFDMYLFEELKKYSCIQIIENTNVRLYERTENGFDIKLDEQTLHADILIACDGASSSFQKSVKPETFNLLPNEYSFGLRAYYQGVSELDTNGFIELHFIKEILPCYFWIFPMPNGRANVGLGLRADIVKQKKTSLPKLLRQIVELPQFKERFANAQLESEPLLHSLPMGTTTRKISGDNYIICGDAAALIDPFTGEGIGNAMLSAKIAAEVIADAYNVGNFNARTLSAYDEKLYRQLGLELRISTRLQHLVNYPSLFNFVVRKANRNTELRNLISDMFESVDLRSQLKNPLFYLKILFN